MSQVQVGLGYFHLDYWIKCPKCKYTPCFGVELSDAKPIYWHPHGLPEWYKTKIVEAINRHITVNPCIFCGSRMEPHKIWINTWHTVKGQASPSGAVQFLISGHSKKEVNPHYLPSGILIQHKCVKPACKYVRYVTL